MARVPYLTQGDLPDEYQELFDVDESDSADVILNVHRAMVNNPRVFEAWGDWVWALYEELNGRTRELVILAVASATDCRYMWQQHVPLALEHGISHEEIAMIAEQEFTEFSPPETAVLEYTIALGTDAITDSLHAELSQFFSEQEIVALLFLGSEYYQLSMVMNAIAVDLEAAFVGWQLEHRK